MTGLHQGETETHSYQARVGRTLLCGAAASGFVSLLKHPLDQSLALVTPVTRHCRTPLLWTGRDGSGPRAEPVLAHLV